jgi:serine O-acetyltransferase
MKLIEWAPIKTLDGIGEISVEYGKGLQAMIFSRIRNYITCIRERDPAVRSTLDLLTSYPGLHAIFLHRLTHHLWGWRWYWFARLLAHFGRWITGIEIHPGAKIGKRFFIDHGMGAVIGETAEIGDDCTLYHAVTLGGITWNAGKRHPTLGNNVVVGAGAKILGPITIGDGARIGSNSVVVRNVPPGATVVGVPGKVVLKIEDEAVHKRAVFSKKIVFDAYGEHGQMPDPVLRAINCLLDYVHELDRKMEILSNSLETMESKVEESDDVNA